jgi:lipopolysaccharide export system protein LptA
VIVQRAGKLDAEADRASFDESKGLLVLEGNVVVKAPVKIKGNNVFYWSKLEKVELRDGPPR